MDKKELKNEKKPIGRPKLESKPQLDIKVDGEYVVIRIPRKDLTKKLLAELI